MANDNYIELSGLLFDIATDTHGAAAQLRELRESLTVLKPALRGSSKGLKPLASGIYSLSAALADMPMEGPARLRDIAAGVRGFSGLKISPAISRQLGLIGSSLRGIPPDSIRVIQELTVALGPLSTLQPAKLRSYIKQIGEIGNVIKQLDQVDMKKFASQMDRLAVSIRPLASEMNKVAMGFSAMPSKIQKLLRESQGYNRSVKTMAHHTNELGYAMKGLKFSAAALIIHKVSDIVSNSVVKAAEYQENLNLFSVSMGEYTEQAYEYAEQVRDIMGINPSSWMRNQGVFMTLASGFGVASDKAYLMSKNLTQLGYDIASFFNLSDEVAMQKLRSALSGELEPVRNLGYALSQNNLQEKYGAEMAKTYAKELEELQRTMSDAGLTQLAMAHGLKTNVAQMTEAEKAQLRYIALMTQNTVVQGDFARTLEDPANQLRIMREQLTMLSQEFGNVFIPMLTKGLPYVIAFVQGLREITRAMAEAAGFQLPDIQNTYLRDEKDALGDVALGFDDATAAAKKYKSYVMGFDELNILDPTEGLGTKKDGLNQFDFDLEQYDYKFLRDAVDQNVAAIRQQMEPFITFVVENMDTILDVTVKIGAALLAWKLSTNVLGMLNFFRTYKTGGKTAGVGAFILDMAAIKGVSENWDKLPEDIKNSVMKLEQVLVPLKIGVGAALAFSGRNIPLGLAMMASGKYAGVTLREENWDYLSDQAKEAATKAGAFGAVGLVGVGAALAFSGASVPLGLGMMMAGIDEASYVAKVNWDSLTSTTQRVMQTFGTISGAALFTAGAVIAFSGANPKLGIGMMALGAQTVYGSISMDPEGMLNWLDKAVSAVTKRIFKNNPVILKLLGYDDAIPESIPEPPTMKMPPVALNPYSKEALDYFKSANGLGYGPNLPLPYKEVPILPAPPSGYQQQYWQGPPAPTSGMSNLYADDAKESKLILRDSAKVETKGRDTVDEDIYTSVYRAVYDAMVDTKSEDSSRPVVLKIGRKELHEEVTQANRESGYTVVSGGAF